jgi:hypothetical protein
MEVQFPTRFQIATMMKMVVLQFELDFPTSIQLIANGKKESYENFISSQPAARREVHELQL